MQPKSSESSESQQAFSTLPEVIERIAKAMANPLRVRIVFALNQCGLMSPSEFIRDCAHEHETEQQIRRQFRQLEAYGLIKEAEPKTGGRRRGGVEHFYRSLQATEFDTPVWDLIPDQFKAVITGAVFHAFGERVSQAMDADTIDERNDRIVAWVTVGLDEVSWKKVMDRMTALYHFVHEEVAQTKDRRAQSGEPLIPTTVGLFAFESPPRALPQEHA